MTETIPLPDADLPRFEALLQALADRLGLSPPRRGLGLELQTDAYTVRVLPEGAGDDLLAIEVDLGTADEAPAQALALLLRINHLARFRHGWRVSLDEDKRLVLHSSRRIARTDAAALERLLADGLQRAGALDALWRHSVAAVPSTDAGPALSMTPGALRA